jgi:SAM-dependent methyltransferase
MPARDFLWLHLRDLPYFRALLRAIEASYYQDFTLTSPILDVGCGDGHFAKITFERPLDVGIDPWMGPIHQARKTGAYLNLIQADGGKMPFPDGYFASGLSNSVLEHIQHIDAVLLETGRVLRQGALFLFSVPNPRYLHELSIANTLHRLGAPRFGEVYRQWFKRMSRVYHADWPEAWSSRLERAGFHLERWWHYFPPQALRVLEWGHYFGAPTLVAKVFFRRWILAPTRWNLGLTERLMRPYADPAPHPQGTFTFYVSVKV